MNVLDPNAPTPEEELADEIKAYEKEQAKQTKAADAEPDPEGDGDEQEIEAAADAEDEGADQDEEAEGDGEAAQEGAAETDARQRQVPLKALQEERAERARLQREFDEMRGQMAAFAQMFQQQQPQQQDAPPPPDPEEDPIGYINYAKQQLADINNWRQQEMQQRQQQAQMQQVQQAYQRNAFEFAQQHPDFKDAYRHLLDNRVAEMRLQGFDDQTIENAMYQEELGLAVSSLRAGVNPAQRIYELAKARGYTPKQGQQRQQARPAVDPALEERKKAAALNTNRSNPPRTPLKVEDLADLDGDKFDKAWNRIFGPENKSFV